MKTDKPGVWNQAAGERASARPGIAVLLFTTLLVLGLASAAPGQNSTGALAGTVLDASGAAVPAAQVVARATGSSFERRATSGGNGEFRLANLPPGAYRVTVSADGFDQAQAEVQVAVGSVRSLSVTLRPAAVRQSVKVAGQGSSISTQPLDLTDAVHQGVVTSEDLATIPLANRSFANIAFLVPGTEPVEPSDPTKARITAVSTGGSSGLNNALSVDGADNSDDYIGGFLQNFSPDAIQEFAVATAQENADTGRTTAGSVVITTKRGTDNWHGDAAFYERAASLNARYPIENPAPDPKQPFSRQNYVGTVGGPIEKGKLWFFSSFEYVRENASIAYSPASLTQFSALATLASQGLIPGVASIAVPANAPVPFRDYLGTTRLDWTQSQRSQWFVRAAEDNYTTDNAFVEQATLPSTGATWHNNYVSLALSNQFTFSPSWLGLFTFGAGGLHLTEARNSNFGMALAFPFSSTSQTISGFETFGDNQFITPITAFPVLRDQEKYEFRYDVTHQGADHSPRFGVDFIHEPVLGGALSGTAETLVTFPENPTFYGANPAQFTADYAAGAVSTPASNGSFSQNVQRLGIYAEDSWRATPALTISYGLRYDTTFGLLQASGRSQLENPAYLTLKALQIPLISGAARDYHGAVAPRLGVAWALGKSANTVVRAGFGLYYDDLAQNGWVAALQAVNAAPAPCVDPFAAPGPSNAGCLPGAVAGGTGAIVAPNYKTPYAVHATGGVQHAFSANWILSADYTHEEGNHAYRAYQYKAGYTLFTPLFAQTDTADQMQYVPDLSVFRSDNRSSYNSLMIHLQGNLSSRLSLVANYTLSKAQTWGCVLGELFDYVNGVCNPLDPFGPGDYGPSGEDVRHRFVVSTVARTPGGFELSLLGQVESARPFTITTPVDVNGLGDSVNDRAVINGVQTPLDGFRGSPYIQFDVRVARPFRLREGWTAMPFVEFFNLFNRNNPGANYVTNLAAMPTPVNNLANATAFCLNASCTQTQPITSLGQLRVPAGALGDFFGPGTTVGVPFAAQIGARLAF